MTTTASFSFEMNIQSLAIQVLPRPNSMQVLAESRPELLQNASGTVGG
jgi:hypothetical protein